MTEAQGSNEIKFRAAMLVLRSLQQRDLITHDEYVALKKKLLRKFSPIIGCLEEVDE